MSLVSACFGTFLCVCFVWFGFLMKLGLLIHVVVVVHTCIIPALQIHSVTDIKCIITFNVKETNKPTQMSFPGACRENRKEGKYL